MTPLPESRRKWMCSVALALTGHTWAATRSGLRVAMVPKQANSPYFSVLIDGVREAGASLGAAVQVLEPNDAHALSQEPFLRQLLKNPPHALILAANDALALLPVLRDLKAAGIAVVAVDADLAHEARGIFVNQASQEGVGRAQVQLMAKLMGHVGKFAVLSATPTATNQNAWIYWMYQELRRPQYKEMRLVNVAYGNDDRVISMEQTRGLLKRYPDLKGIVAPTTVGIAAAAQVLESLQPRDKLHITGLGTPNQMRDFVQRGTVQAFQLWNPADLGYLAVYAAAHLSGSASVALGSGQFTAGRLGNFTVGSRGEVVLGTPTTFDATNINQFHF